MIPLLVLAGGFGTRLRDAVADVPKPLAPIAGVPFLKLLGGHWVAGGATEFVFLLHHGADQVTGFLEEEARSGFLVGRRYRVAVDPEPLGTGGAVAYAVRQLGLTGSFLVGNADTWVGGDLAALASSAAPAMAVVGVSDTSRYGSVRVERGRVTGFEEKRDARGAGRINAGLYHLSSSLFEAWDGRPLSLERDVFPSLAARGALSAVPMDGDFIDIGIPEDYFRFQRWIEGGRTGAL